MINYSDVIWSKKWTRKWENKKININKLGLHCIRHLWEEKIVLYIPLVQPSHFHSERNKVYFTDLLLVKESGISCPDLLHQVSIGFRSGGIRTRNMTIKQWVKVMWLFFNNLGMHLYMSHASVHTQGLILTLLHVAKTLHTVKFIFCTYILKTHFPDVYFHIYNQVCLPKNSTAETCKRLQ